MRLLLDEHLPVGLSAEFHGHGVDTVSGRGWTGIKNGELLRRMTGQYDVLVTMDRGIEFQQRLSIGAPSTGRRSMAGDAGLLRRRPRRCSCRKSRTVLSKRAALGAGRILGDRALDYLAGRLQVVSGLEPVRHTDNCAGIPVGAPIYRGVYPLSLSVIPTPHIAS